MVDSYRGRHTYKFYSERYRKEAAVYGQPMQIQYKVIQFLWAVIGNNFIVGAGTLVTGKMNAPVGSLILGNPAKVVKELTEEQIEGNRQSAEHYIAMAQNSLPILE